jgi:hypothetical protein
LLGGGGGGGGGEGMGGRKSQESLVLFISLNTLWAEQMEGRDCLDKEWTKGKKNGLSGKKTYAGWRRGGTRYGEPNEHKRLIV